MKKQKKNFKFTKKHFIICTVIFALLILIIYGNYRQTRDRKLKDANKALSYKENISSSHYHWPDEGKELERTNSWTYSHPKGKFTATITYLANDTSTIYLKRVTQYADSNKDDTTEYGALVMPHMSHSQEVFSVINKSGKEYFGTEQSIYTRYGTSVEKTELSISQLTKEGSTQDGTRFLFWSDHPKGDFKFVGIVSMSRIKPSGVANDHTPTYVRNIAYSFGKAEVTKVKGAAQYATWAYVDALLHFELPDDKDKFTTTKLVLAMNQGNERSKNIAERLGFEEGNYEDKEYSYSDGRDARITNENMDIYVMDPNAWKQTKHNQVSSSSIAIEREVGGGVIGRVIGGLIGGGLIGAVGGAGLVGGVGGAGIGAVIVGVVGAAIGKEGGGIEVIVVVIGGIIGASILAVIGETGGIVEVIVGAIAGAIAGAIGVGIGAGIGAVILGVIGARIGGEIGELIGARIVGEIVGAIVAGVLIKFYFYDDDPNLDPAEPA